MKRFCPISSQGLQARLLSVSCRGHEPSPAVRVTVHVTEVDGTGAVQRRDVEADPYFLVDDFQPSKRKDGTLLWYADAVNRCFWHGYVRIHHCRVMTAVMYWMHVIDTFTVTPLA